jgi:tetratricopeptide (TPR) repeat protein
MVSFMPDNKQALMIYLFLTIATLASFWQVTNGDFIYYDDPKYVTNNINVQNGITLEGIRWAFTTGHVANWHPVTWISHMLDVQFFGLQPRWHHLTNLLFHLANTLLLFFVLHRMTKARWESAFVAALFALHPLHVESVAWVAERKDVLSTFFLMFTLGAYCLYVERPQLKRYLLVIVFFGLGLMAKPMLVTVPFVLLLLDYWPLQRFRQKSDQKIRSAANKPVSGDKQKKKKSRHTDTEPEILAEIPAGAPYQWALIRPLVLEKAPLFALTILSSIVTYIVQKEGGAVQALPLFVRIPNAFVSYVTYMGKTIWPHDLAVFYPFPMSMMIWQVLGAVLLLAAATTLVLRKARKAPYLATGWLWYMGTLVPVVGFVQVGIQARADRYTYVPLIGLFIIAAWGISELSRKWRYRKEILIASSTTVLLGLCVVTWTQVRYWQNSITLFDHAVNATNDNYIAYFNRGASYRRHGDDKQAIRDYDKALEINPNYGEVYINRGVARAALGEYSQAIGDYNKAIEIKPHDADAYYNRGVVYAALGNFSQAIGDYDRALELKPRYAEAHNNRGVVYAALGNDGQAIGDYDKAVEINPNNAEAYYNRGNSYARLGNYQQAIKDYDSAIKIKMNYGEAYNNRAYAYWRLGNAKQSIEDLKTAARLGSIGAQKTLKSKEIGW